MLFDNAIDGGESQARTLSGSLGSKERLEDSFSYVGIHADPCVADTKLGESRWLNSRSAAASLFGKLDIMSLNG
jgi:hypothetical protein